MSQQKSYIDLTRSRSEENPCLRPLVDHLAQGRYGAHVSSGDVPKVYCVNFEETPSGMQTPRVAKASLPEIVRDLEPSTSSQPRGITQRIIIVEDIDQRTIETLGKTLNIDPIFFAHYLLTDLQNMEKTPAPPSFAMPPSSFVSRDSIHLHYQQIVDLGKELPAKSKIYKYKTAGNVPRLARCPPALSNIQLGILRSCCSALLKDLGNDSWACLILVDNSSKRLIPISSSKLHGPLISKLPTPIYGGYEEFCESEKISESTPPLLRDSSTGASLLHNLMRYYRKPPPGLNLKNPNLLSLIYYPLKIVLAQWMSYVLLMNRFYKFYEFSITRNGDRYSLETDIVELQRWRRRGRQSLHKLRTVIKFLSMQDPASQARNQQVASLSSTDAELANICSSLAFDYGNVVAEMEDYSKGIEFIISVSTAMVQVGVARQSILEAVNVRRLTYIALIYGSLGGVATIFSMSDDFLPGSHRFWIYLVTSLITLAIAVGIVIILNSSSWNRRKLS